MERELFCERSPLCYALSVHKERLKRRIKWISIRNFSKIYSKEALPHTLYTHKSLIRRKLGNVDPVLQENKATNLALSTPKVNGILIRPGEVFSFWYLVGSCTKRKGYKEGLIIKKGMPDKDIGGGMCQFTNLLHWMVLHSPLDIVEHHHHNQYDLFPDYNRQLPFGVGTSIMFNYLDYRVENNTDNTFQFEVEVKEDYLCGRLNAKNPINESYHIEEKEAYFTQKGDVYYRHNKVYRKIIDKKSGELIREEFLIENNAKVMYDKSFIGQELIKKDA